MVLYFRKWINRLKFALLFAVCTFALYHVLAVLTTWIEPMNNKYREPSGRALKVFQYEHKSLLDGGSISDRLRLFYWYGE
jgi:hypothetical protein